MTSKGQVTVPKDIRDALGLCPGYDVEFEMTAEGDAVIRKATDTERLKVREAEVMRGVMEARQLYQAEGVDLGMNPLEYVDWVRGAAAEV